MPIQEIKIKAVTPITSTFVDMDTDKLILARVKNGDEEAFEQLFKKYYVMLSHFACQFVNSMPDSEELVQDTFVSIWEKRGDLNINTSFKSYIYGAVKNRGLNSIRGDQRRKKHHSRHDGNVIDLSNAYDQLLHVELNDKLFEGLEILPPKCREIFHLSRFENLKHKEIAVEMGIKVKTVENQIGIALKYLRKHLSEYLQIFALIFSTSNL